MKPIPIRRTPKTINSDAANRPIVVKNIVLLLPHACNDLTPSSPSRAAFIACAAAWLAASVVK